MAIKQVQPDIPEWAGRIDATVAVDIIIDEAGKVVCAKARSSHALLRRW